MPLFIGIGANTLLAFKAMFGIYRHLNFANKGNKKIAYSQTIIPFSLSSSQIALLKKGFAGFGLQLRKKR